MIPESRASIQFMDGAFVEFEGDKHLIVGKDSCISLIPPSELDRSPHNLDRFGAKNHEVEYLRVGPASATMSEGSLSNIQDIMSSDASYIPPSSDPYDISIRRSILSSHRDISTRPTTYNQLIDYLEMLSVPIITSSITQGRMIGLGATFIVHDGVLHNHINHSSLVAIKTPRESIHQDPDILRSIIREVLDEIRVMSHLSLHPNVATIFGIALEEKQGGLFLPRLVVERAIGSLGHLLRGFGQIPWTLKHKFCLEIANGLEALHAIQIVHSDVKSDNILIFHSTSHWTMVTTPQLVAKVSDFGFCVPDTTARDSSVAAKGTLPFKAPETLPEAPPAFHVYANLPERDIYSYGILVWEVMNDGKVPFSIKGSYSGEDVAQVARLKLSTENGAGEFLIASCATSTSLDYNIQPFLDTIRGTVRRQPSGERGRLSWQKIFDTLLGAVEKNDMSPDPDYKLFDYYSDKNLRQRRFSWNEFQQVPWLPKIPVPSATWKDSDNIYTQVMLRELELSSKSIQRDWISIIRLCIHFFQVSDIPKMKELLRTFSDGCRSGALGDYGAALLHLAIQTDAVDIIRAILRKSVDANALDVHSRTPLHVVRSASAAEVLIQHGADVNWRWHSSPTGDTPLHLASSGDIAEILLQNGADVHSRGHSSSTPLHTACSADIVRILVQYGADPLAKDLFGYTPLHKAFNNEVAISLTTICPEAITSLGQYNRTPLHSRIADWTEETVKHMVQSGANVNALDDLGQTPLECCKNNLAGARVLVSAGATPGVGPSNRFWVSPLDNVTNPAAMEFLLQNGFREFVSISTRRNGDTPLHIVANRDSALRTSWGERLGNILPVEMHWREPPPSGMAHLLTRSHLVPSRELMETLLRHGADPNIRNRDHDTPLHLVARNVIGHDGHNENIALLDCLVNAGADVNAINKSQETPLLSAARAETLMALLNAGADPKVADKDGATILHNILRFSGSCKEVVSALIDKGADIEATDRRGYTALHYVCEPYEEKKNLTAWRRLSRWRELTHANVPDHLALLLQSAYETRMEALIALLDHHANVNARTNTGLSPLRLLSRQPFANEAYRLLLSHGAELQPDSGHRDRQTFMSIVLSRKTDLKENEVPWWYSDKKE